MKKHKKKNAKQQQDLAFGLLIGLLFGIPIGVSQNSPAVGISMVLCFGLALSCTGGKKKKAAQPEE
ncbi:MAG: hypothetical protein LUD78_09820 [Clostridiales bacterium]|nr:hypothetical protein [Clostridiales bacterium]